MNKLKVAYWLSTGIMCAIFLFSAQMYIFNYEMVVGFFKALGFPSWLIYPMATLKILAVLLILSKQSYFLKELAYAGLFFNAVLAFSAHLMAHDSGFQMAALALITLLFSWRLDRAIYP